MSFALSLVMGLTAIFGLGSLWRGPSFGATALVGSVFLMVGLLVLDLVLGINLYLAARLLFALSVVILLVRIYFARGRGWKEAALHPAIMLPLAVAVAALLRSDVGYLPFSWDEFSAWITWPQEAYVTGSFATSGSIWFGLAYTQGLPALSAFPQLVLLGNFDPARLLVPQMLLHAALLGLAYEVIADRLRVAGWNDRSSQLAAWAVVLGLLAVEAAWTLIPQLALVEKPQIYLFSAMILLLIRAERTPQAAGSLWIAIGILAAGAYLIKATTISFVPSLLVAVWVSARQTPPERIRAIAALLVPLTCVWLFWRFASPATAVAGCGGNPLAALSGADRVGELVSTALRVLRGFADYTFSYKFPVTVVSLAAIAFSVRDRTTKPAIIALSVWSVLYFVGLIGTYGLCFSGYEADNLASLQRYSRILLRVIHVVGLVMAAEATFVWIGTRHANKGWATGALVTVVAGLSLFQMWALARTFTNLEQRTLAPPNTVAQVAKATAEGNALARLLKAQNRTGAEVLLIVQNGDGFEHVIARRLGLGRAPGEQRRYHLQPGISFGPAVANTWTAVVTPKEMTAKLLGADVVWPLAVDDWLKQIVAPLVTTSECAERPQDFFFFRKADGRSFDCFPKQAWPAAGNA